MKFKPFQKDDRRIILTKHAIDRGRSFRLNISEIIKLISNSIEEPQVKGDNIIFKKGKKFKHKDDITYWRNGTIVFTLKEKIDFKTNKKIWLVITVYDQTVDLYKL